MGKVVLAPGFNGCLFFNTLLLMLPFLPKSSEGPHCQLGHQQQTPT